MEHSNSEFQLAEACADLEFRLRSGERDVAQQILQSQPVLASNPECAIEVIYVEYVILSELGEAPELPELREQFPEHGDRIERLLKIHRAFNDETQNLKLNESTLPHHLSVNESEFLVEHPDEQKSERRLGQYDLIEVIARGGMGVVWKARQRGLGRLVAIKRIRDSLPDQEERRRFLAEAETAARLHHPNIAQVFEVGQENGESFLSLEFVDGVNLRDKISRTPLTPYESCVLIEKVARAVEYAHEHGVIHRDLKPANILLTKNGEPKVTDFGLAKVLRDETPQYTRTGTILGTPAYMSPEQATGRVDEIGPPSDVFSIGVILFELLTGQTPFKGRSEIETIRMVCESDPSSIRKQRPEISRDLETICFRCLEKSPSIRYSGAGIVADELQRFLTGVPIEARSISSAERIWKWTRRRPTIATLLSLLLVAMVLGFAGGGWQWLRAEREWRRAESERKRLKHALDDSKRANLAESFARENSERSNYYQQIGIVQSELAAGDHAAGLRILEECPVRFRGWEWHYLKQLCQTPLLNIEHAGKSAYRLRFSPDNQLLAIAFGSWGSRTPGIVQLIDVKSGKIKFELVGLDGPARDVCFSPDGKHVAAACTRFNKKDSCGVRVWETSTGKKLAGFEAPRGRTFCLDYSPDGKEILIGRGHGDIEILNSQTGKLLRKLGRHSGIVLTAQFSPDGNLVATGGRDGDLQIWQYHEGKLFEKISGLVDVRSVAFSPDGSQLAAGTFGGLVKIWKVQSKTDHNQSVLVPLGLHNQDSIGLSQVRYTPDGRHLAICSTNGGIQVIEPETAKLVMRCWPENTTCSSIDFDNGVERFAFASDNRTRIRRFERNSIDPLHTEKFAISAVAWQPYRSIVAIAAGDNTTANRGKPTIVLIDSNKSSKIGELNGMSRWIQRIHWDDEGEYLAAVDEAGTVQLWQHGKSHLPVGKVSSPGERIRDVAHLKNDRIAVGSHSGKIQIWNWRQVTCQHEIKSGHKSISNIACFKGRWLITAGNDNQIHLWDASSLEIIATVTINAKKTEIESKMVASSVGNCVAVAVGREIYSADIQFDVDGRPRFSKPVKLGEHLANVTSLCFDSSGQRVLSACKQDVSILWDVVAKCQAIRLADHWERSDVIGLNPHGQEMISVRGANWRLSEERTGRSSASNFWRHMNAIFWHEDQLQSNEQNDELIEFHQNWLIHRRTALVNNLIENEIVSLDLPYEQMLLAKGFLTKGDIDNANRHLQGAKTISLKLLEKDSENPAHHQMAALVYRELGDRKMSLIHSAKSAELAPKSARLLNEHAWFLTLLADPTEDELRSAVEFAKRAIKLSRKNGSYWNTLGVARFRLGEFTQAEKDLLNSVKYSGGSAFDHFPLAIMKAKSNPGEAQEWYEKGCQAAGNISRQHKLLQEFKSMAEQALKGNEPRSAP